jgi:hypothetical protein
VKSPPVNTSANRDRTQPAPVAGEASPGGSGWRATFIACAVGWLAFFASNPERFFQAGIQHFRATVASGGVQGVWFLDSYALLASNDAVSAGRDPYAPNPLDYLDRPHLYGPGWLHLRDFGLTRADNFRVGLGLGLAFVVAVMLWLRPRSLRSLLWHMAVFGSIPVLLALERANNDLVIFLVLTPVVPCLLAGRAAVRWLALGFIALAADLKFYPAVGALLLLATAPPRELRWRIAVGAALFAAVGWHVAGDLRRIVPLLPDVEGVFSFGAVAGFHELGWHGACPQTLAASLGVLMFLGCWRMIPLEGWTPAPAQRSAWLHFVLGATLLAGCFFTSQNYAYRWVFALWLVPLLWSLPRDPQAPVPVRQLARTTGWLLIVALWFDPLCTLVLSQWPGLDLVRALHWVFLVEQPFTWALFACLSMFLAQFVRHGLRALWGREAVA